MNGVRDGYQYRVTQGPSIDAITKAFAEAIDTAHPKWPKGVRTVDFTSKSSYDQNHPNLGWGFFLCIL